MEMISSRQSNFSDLFVLKHMKSNHQNVGNLTGRKVLKIQYKFDGKQQRKHSQRFRKMTGKKEKKKIKIVSPSKKNGNGNVGLISPIRLLNTGRSLNKLRSERKIKPKYGFPSRSAKSYCHNRLNNGVCTIQVDQKTGNNVSSIILFCSGESQDPLNRVLSPRKSTRKKLVNKRRVSKNGTPYRSKEEKQNNRCMDLFCRRKKTKKGLYLLGMKSKYSPCSHKKKEYLLSQAKKKKFNRTIRKRKNQENLYSKN